MIIGTALWAARKRTADIIDLVAQVTYGLMSTALLVLLVTEARR